MYKRTPRAAPPGSEASSSPSFARRRIVTGGVAAGATSLLLPAQWAPPVVESVLLPAHAQTSQIDDNPDNPECTAEAGCYVIQLFDGDGNPDGEVSFFWAGGTGPHEAPFFTDVGNNTCEGESTISETIVLAENAEAAAGALGTEDVFELDVPPETVPGCGFFGVD